MRTTITFHILASLHFLLVNFMEPAAAQNPRVESLTIANGLSQGMIYDIEQTPDGFLWFATKDGLNRFDGYRFEVFTNDPFNPFSIAGNDIFRMFQDSRGNLWLTLDDKGLDMLDQNTGRFFHFPPFTHEDRLWKPSTIVETPDGTYWVATGEGLLHLSFKASSAKSQDGRQRSSLDKNNPDLLASMTMEVVSKVKTLDNLGIPSLRANPDGSLIISTLDKGICRFSPKDQQLTVLLPTPGGLPNLFEIAPGKVWTMWNDQFFLIENGSTLRKMSLGKMPEGFEFHRIFPDGRGNLIWVGSSILKGSHFFTMPEDVLLRNGSASQPTFIYHAKKFSPWADVDRSGNLWIGSSGYGLQKIHLASQPFQYILPGRSIRQISVTGERVYLPNDLGSKSWLDEATSSLHTGTEFPEIAMLHLLEQASDGTVYFLGVDHQEQQVLGIRKNAKNRLLKLPYSLGTYVCLLLDSKGRLWMGATPSRLMCYLPQEDNIVFFDLSQQLGATAELYALHEDIRHNIWVGSTNGVLKMEIGKMEIGKLKRTAAGEVISNFPISQFQTISTNPRSLRHNFATSFCADPLEPERYLWVSTKGGGLNLLDMTTGEFQHFTSQNSGLPNDVVYGILPDFTPLSGGAGGVGNIWCSTNRGLSRLTVSESSAKPTANSQSPTATRTYRFRNFREFDGLQSDEFNTSSFARSPNGKLFFGGVNGLTVFDPSEIIDRKSDAPVRITGLKINNLPVTPLPPSREVSPLDRPIHQTTHLRLDHTQRILTLEFALMDFVLPTENRYRYRLQGADPDWVEAGTNHSANYVNLRPGSYTFEVQGSIPGGDWSKSALLQITVLPPWWASWWAYILYVLALGGAFFWFYKNHLRQRLEHQEALRLRELDEFKNRFFTNITHEFRTPLTVILGNLEIMKLEIERQVSQFPIFLFLTSKISILRRNGENLLRLINQILDLAKLENKSLTINYVQGNVLPYLRYVAESLQSLANAQNVLLRVESTEAQIVMDYDPERLLQIVHNLLSNAIKFTPSGGRVTMKLEIGNWEIEKLSSSPISQFPISQFLISVSDTGVGIPPEDLPKIFDRFYQANNLEKAKAGGTGIGLSLTRELVKAMGGEISVESQMRKGTTFFVKLPVSNTAEKTSGDLKLDAATPSRRDDIFVASDSGLGSRSVGTVSGEPKHTVPTERQPSGEAISTNISSLRDGARDAAGRHEKPSILLVEDNPDVVEYLAACLGENYQLDFAYNGRAGIEKALETVPDLILSDVMMPEKDGFEVCDTLKNDERTSHIPIVLLTAKADVESRIAGLKRGADAYLAKPFHQEELTVTLANLLELRRKLQARYSKLEIGNLEIPQGESPISQFPISPISNFSFPDPEDAFLKKLHRCIGENLGDNGFDGGRLAKAMNLSEVQLYRKIKALTDKSTAIFIRSVRLQKGRELLQTTSLNVSEIAYEVGFDDPNYFSRTFSQEFGAAPSEVRK